MVYIFVVSCKDENNNITFYNCISKSTAITLKEKLATKFPNIQITKNKLYGLNNLGDIIL